MNEVPTTLAGLPATRRARKLPEEVQVRFARAPGSCATLEGEVRYETGDALVEAEAGDRWAVRREVFRARYEAVAPTQPGQDGRYRKRSAEVLARRLDAALCVPLPDGRGELCGKPGDWLVEYGPADFAIVAGDIFDHTYELLAD
jgi:hypothetical protein